MDQMREMMMMKKSEWRLSGVFIALLLCSLLLWIVTKAALVRYYEEEERQLRLHVIEFEEEEDEDEGDGGYGEYNGETPPICVFFHLGTRSEWSYYAPFLANLRHQPHDLYVTVPLEDWDPMADCETLEGYKANATEALKPDFDPQQHGHRVFVLPMENRGLDGGGFLVAMDEVLRKKRNYKYMLKLHSKTNRHNWNGIPSDWRRRLLESIVSSPAQVDKCLALFESDPTVGMIGAPGLIFTEYIPAVQQFAARYHLPSHKPNVTSRFIAGTMFWVRFELVASPFSHHRDHGENREVKVDPWFIYRDAPLGFPDYEWTGHMLERLYGEWVELQGYKVQGLSMW